jgi:hypothetical protein
MHNYWMRRADVCHTCQIPLNVEREFIEHPTLLTVSVADMNTAIDQNVFFQNLEYSIFAVGYRSQSHFIALLKVDDNILEYDGMVRNGLLHHFGNTVDCFKSEIKDLSNCQ